MKKILHYSRVAAFALCVMLSASLLSGCVVISFDGFNSREKSVSGEGNPESFSIDVGEFSELKVELLCEIEYYSAASCSVTLEVQPNLRDYIVVEESGGVLSVRTNRNILWSGKAPVLTVKSPSLNKASFSGAGSLTLHDTITADSFSLILQGTLDCKAKFDVNKLIAEIEGMGSIELSGRADNADISVDGTSKVDALSLQTCDASVSLNGISTVKISCSDNLYVEADGLGTVEYQGSPSIDMDTNGPVSVKKIK